MPLVERSLPGSFNAKRFAWAAWDMLFLGGMPWCLFSN